MKNLFLSICLLAFSGFSATAQSSAADPSLTTKAQNYADEVFLECNQYAQPGYIEMYVQMLSRVEIKTESFSSSESYIPLSTIGLKNKCNTALERDTELTFNPENFNPFKYHLDFLSKTDVTYRVDNTPYIIVIHP
jgi:hypothetical protein